MAHRIRSLISDKVAQALHTVYRGAKDVTPASLLPYIQVDPQAKQPPEFKLSLRDVSQPDPANTEAPQALGGLGAALVARLETDALMPAVYIRQTKTETRLQFKVNPSQLVADVVGSVTDRPTDFWRMSGLVKRLPPERILVEFSSPNIAKPFHVGHLRSTIIGNFVANVASAAGHPVTRLNFLGDWGTQFGLLKYGYDAHNLTPSDLESDAIAKLHRAYVYANQRAEQDPTVAIAARDTFARMEAGNEAEITAWETFRSVSIRDLKRVYGRLNVCFDEYHGESMYPKEACRGVLRDMEAAGMIRVMDDGRKVCQVRSGHEVTVEKSDGSSLYLTRDVAAAVDRFRRYGFTRMYYVVENGQTDHFSALFSVLKGLGHPWAPCLRHVKFGRVRGMSSRKGTAVALEDLLDGARHLMASRQQQAKTTKRAGEVSGVAAAEELAVSSVIVGDLKQRRQRDYTFSWDKALQATGDTGVRLQYLHCRLVSLERQCGVACVPGDLTTDTLQEPQAIALAVEIARFDEVLVETYRELEACILLAYLFRLCSVTNVALRHLPVKGSGRGVAEARLALFMASRHTLAAAMAILGLRPMTHM